MAELSTDATLVVADVGEIDGGAEVDRKAQVFAVTVIVSTGGKAGCEDDFFSKEDIDAGAAEKIAVALRDGKEADEGADTAKV